VSLPKTATGITPLLNTLIGFVSLPGLMSAFTPSGVGGIATQFAAALKLTFL